MNWSHTTVIALSREPHMEFYAYAFADSPPSCPRSSFLNICLQTYKNLTAKSVIGNIVSVIIALFYGIVGTLLGAINGAVIGKQSENSHFRGAVVGAVSGALLSVEVFESFLRLWSSNGKGIQCFLYLGDVLANLVNGELVRERVGPILITVRRPNQSTGIIFENAFEHSNGNTRLSMDIVEKIPRVEITPENHADSCGQNISCSVCLDDFQVGDEARKLPHCNHMFHPSCIDQWLIKCGSCPLCRSNI